ncbi:hypothetical protein LCGC14_2279730, partial [marine sediment metagenome]
MNWIKQKIKWVILAVFGIGIAYAAYAPPEVPIELPPISIVAQMQDRESIEILRASDTIV